MDFSGAGISDIIHAPNLRSTEPHIPLDSVYTHDWNFLFVAYGQVTALRT